MFVWFSLICGVKAVVVNSDFGSDSVWITFYINRADFLWRDSAECCCICEILASVAAVSAEITLWASFGIFCTVNQSLLRFVDELSVKLEIKMTDDFFRCCKGILILKASVNAVKLRHMKVTESPVIGIFRTHADNIRTAEGEILRQRLRRYSDMISTGDERIIFRKLIWEIHNSVPYGGAVFYVDIAACIGIVLMSYMRQGIDSVHKAVDWNRCFQTGFKLIAAQQWGKSLWRNRCDSYTVFKTLFKAVNESVVNELFSDIKLNFRGGKEACFVGYKWSFQR